jgi:type IV pilus assembly protein PilF
MMRRVLLVVFSILMTACVTQSQTDAEIKNTKARARSHTDLGAVYLQERRYEIALEEYILATEIDPGFAVAHNGLGLVYAALGQDKQAEQYFRKAIQLDPNNSEAHNNYGNFLCARNRIDESIKEFMEAVKNPLYVTPEVAYTNAGICALRKQDIANAETYLQKALQIQPLNATAAYQLASIQFDRHQFLLAKKTLQSVVMTQPKPENLWLSVQIARKLGLREEESSFSLQLRRMYPDSEQAQLLLSGN